MLAISHFIFGHVMRKATSAECQNIQMQRGKALHQAALFSGSQAPWIWRDRGMLGLLHQHLDVWRCGATMKDEVLSFTAVSLTTTPSLFSYVSQKLSSFLE